MAMVSSRWFAVATFAHVWCAAVLHAQIPDFRSQIVGIQPLSETTLSEALSRGAHGEKYLFDPFEIRELTIGERPKHAPIPPYEQETIGELRAIAEAALLGSL